MAAGRYELTGKKFDGKGQAKMVYDVMVKLNRPVTVHEVVGPLAATPGFLTTQTTQRIAAYYVCVFNKSGVVRLSSAPAIEAFGGKADDEAGITTLVETV